MTSPSSRGPAISVPPGTLALTGLLAGTHLLRVLFWPGDETILRFGLVLLPAGEASPGTGQWYRWVTHAFLHGGTSHLLVNLGFILAAGTGIERMAGPWRMWLVFLAGVAGGALGQWLLSAHGILLGASGGGAALFAGVVLMLVLRRPAPARNLLVVFGVFAILNLAFVLPVPGELPVAWIAHISGFLAGFAATVLLLPPGAPGGMR